MKRFIGQIIEEEVRKQGIPISRFANMIHTSRNNVYDIFARNNIDIDLLRVISIELKHNYFEDLAKNPELAFPNDVPDAVTNFFRIVPQIFQDLNIDAFIFSLGDPFCKEGKYLPDFMLTDYNFTFTIGETFQEKSKGAWEGITFYPLPGEAPGRMIGYIDNEGIQYLDITIDIKSEKEWKDTIRFALEYVSTWYCPRTIYKLQELRNEN